MNLNVRDFAEPLLSERITVRNFEECTMDFRPQKQILLERAKRVEKRADRENNADAQDIMRALALLYREMAEELDDSWLFERRFLPYRIG